MAKHFSDMNSLNIISMFEYILYNTHILNGANRYSYTNVVFSRITYVFM